MTYYPLTIAGSALTGSDGATGRTYTISATNIVDEGFHIYVNGLFLHLTTDYTRVGTLVTFVNAMFNDMVIFIEYYDSIPLVSDTSASLRYTSVTDFWKRLGISLHTLDFDTGQTATWETVGTGDGSNASFYLDQMGVNEDVLSLRRSSDSAALTVTTHYTFDSDRSSITLTGAGVTYLSTANLQGAYEYNSLGKYLRYNLTADLLESAEDSIDDMTNMTFADQSASYPNYTKVVNELLPGRGEVSNLYHLNYGPIVKLSTTVNGAYTTGSASLTLTSAAGFPSTATIYIGGNKVTYTAKSGNVLTVPITTPSIADGAVVRGDVIEVSLDPAGVTTSFTVLTPDVDYSLDYDTGELQLLDDYYVQNLYGLVRPADGIKDRIRVNYMTAWHEVGQDCEIPVEIKDAVYKLTASRLTDMNILKSNVNVSENFSPVTLRDVNSRLSESLNRYKKIRVYKV